MIEAKKRKLAEKKDMAENKELVARNENIKKLIAEKESKQAKNKGEEVKNKGEEAKNKGEEAKNKGEEAKNKGEEAKNKGEAEKNQGEKELLLRQQKLIKAAKESYQNLSPDLKQHSPEEINTKINALSPNTKARLKKSGLSLSDYAQFSLAREKITSLDTKTPEGESFLTTLKKMEKSLGIVEKTDGGYPLSNEPRKETFEQNPQLMEFAKNDESLKSLEKVNVLDDKLNIKQQQKIFQLF